MVPSDTLGGRDPATSKVRAFDNQGTPTHKDNQTVVKERIYLDKADKTLLHNDLTTIDHALTRPWTVNKTYRRQGKTVWVDNNCGENNNHVEIGNELYVTSGDGLLMPTRKDQPPPDLRYFNKR